MKATQPKYYNDCKVTCACGNSFSTGSTFPEMQVDICSGCHPFFTGESKYVDILGRVERFKQKQQSAITKKYVKKADRKKLREKQEEKLARGQKTLKEMLGK